MARPMIEVPQHSNPSSSSNMTDRAILYQRYLEHYQRQLEDDDEDEEEEHVHALDLRICKVNESISRHNASDIWQQSQAASESSATILVQQQPSGSRTSPQPLGIEPGSVARNPSVLSPNSVSHVGATALPLLSERNMSPPRLVYIIALFNFSKIYMVLCLDQSYISQVHTLNIDLILWHTQLIVCVVKC